MTVYTLAEVVDLSDLTAGRVKDMVVREVANRARTAVEGVIARATNPIVNEAVRLSGLRGEVDELLADKIIVSSKTTFKDLYPVSVNDISMSADATDTLAQMHVSFVFRTFETEYYLTPA